MPAPTRADLLAAARKTVPDVIAPNLQILFCGINPGLYSAYSGHHFARPGNRFWPALHLGGFTPRLFTPAEEQELLPLGYGITNLVERASATADELTKDELAAGGKRLAAKVEEYAPHVLAVLGVRRLPQRLWPAARRHGAAAGAYRPGTHLDFAEPKRSKRPLHAGSAGRGVWRTAACRARTHGHQPTSTRRRVEHGSYSRDRRRRLYRFASVRAAAGGGSLGRRRRRLHSRTTRGRSRSATSPGLRQAAGFTFHELDLRSADLAPVVSGVDIIFHARRHGGPAPQLAAV